MRVQRSKVDYFTLVKKWGIPSFRYRWCCRELKIKPIEDFLATIQEPKVVFDGIRVAESKVRKEYIPIWYYSELQGVFLSVQFLIGLTMKSFPT